MITEIVTLTAAADRADEFAGVYADSSADYFSGAGCLGQRLVVSDTDPGVFTAIIDWQDLSAQQRAVASDAGQRFLAGIGPLLQGAPVLGFHTPVAP